MLNNLQFGKYREDKKDIIERLEIKDRDIEFKPRKNLITTVIGPRRSGKTYLFFSLIKKYGVDESLYLNFGDIELEGATKEDILKYFQLFQEVIGYKPEMVFFDEVQNIPYWEKAVNEIFEKKETNIFITWSSSKLLGKEIATQLRGRGIKHILLPLSFKEYLMFHNWKFKKIYSTTEENRLKGMLWKFLKSGAFPDVVLEPDAAFKFFEEYIDLVIYRDLVERFGIKNLYLLKTLIRSILASYSKEMSIHRMFKMIKSQGISVSKKTLYNYSEYLQDAMFSFILPKFSYSTRTSDLSIPKVYLADTGLATYSRRFEIGRAMENSVYLELKRLKDKNPNLDLYYWQKSNKEVDFILKDAEGIKTLLQITYELTPDNYEREIAALLKASLELDCLDMWLITWDEERELEVGNRRIRIVPLWKWFLLDQ